MFNMLRYQTKKELIAWSSKVHFLFSFAMLNKKITKASFIGKYGFAYQHGFSKAAPLFRCIKEFQPFWEEEQEKYKYFFIKASRSLQLESLVDITFD